jgi:peroxiredoxin
MIKKSLGLITLLCLHFSLLHAQSDADSEKQMVENFRKSLLGKSMADFDFKDIKGNKLSKKKLEGKVIVMNLWFTACQPCRVEMPLLNQLTDEYKNKNVVFIAPALDEAKYVAKFLQKNTFNYQIVAGQEAYANKMKVEIFPTHLITDKKGVIQEVIVGYHADIKDKLGKVIDGLL